ncbi:MAG: glycosyltransferase family 4 protein [Prevotella sp.]|nr:glycosyltransferase family 4 protein [Prevotella sp.]
MKVLIVNTSERTGGAAVAAGRLCDALNNNGVKARMLVRDKQSDNINVIALPRSPLLRWHFLWERWVIFWRLHFKREHLFEIDIANSGSDITRLPAFREADVIHLHWVNQGMLSLSDIRRILLSGKPVVWTMHDLWPATAICHYARGCRRYSNHCQICPLLPGGGSANDLAARTWSRKEQMLNQGSIAFVACSRWLEGEAKKSALLRGHLITSIPNAIDTRIYRPQSRSEARSALQLPQEGNVILFVSQRVTDERKGISFFIDALHQLVDQHPELKENTSVAILGGHADEVAQQLPLPAHALGYIADEHQIVNVYNAADVFVTPSLEDNLPNTIMEAMACGVPCVGFRVGGIPEMIDHQQNGFLVEPRNSSQLASGMAWVLCHPNRQELQQHAVKKVMHSYSQQSVALRYIELYQQTLAQKHFML